MKVMIVDEQASVRTALEPLIREWGYETATAASGEEAWQQLAAGSRPAIVLVAGEMPDRQGVSLCAKLKKEQGVKNYYVIALTGKSGRETVVRTLEAGADDFIAKPVKPGELLSRLTVGRRVLEYQSTLDNLTRELAAKNQEMSKMGSIDGLTGIASRGYFNERLAEEWRRALRMGSPVSLIIFDIDFFKDYNETYGHIAGDECLKKVGKTIAATIARASDFAARYSGEEFAVVLPNTDSLGALVVAEAVRVAVATMGIEHRASAIHRHLTVSAGTATLVPDELTAPEALVALAEQALYQAKVAGRNNVKQATV